MKISFSTAMIFLWCMLPMRLNAKSNAEKTLIKIKKNIVSSLKTMDKSAKKASKDISKSGIKSRKTRKIISELYKKTGFAVDTAFVDGTGKISIVEPIEYGNVEGADISGQEQVLFVKNNKTPVLSDVFHSVEGFNAIDFEYPVLIDKKFAGSVSILFKPETFFTQTVGIPDADQTYHFYVINGNWSIIHDSAGMETGVNIKNLPDNRLFTLLSEGQRQGKGICYFTYPGTDKTRQNPVYWDTAAFYQTEWKLVLIAPSEE